MNNLTEAIDERIKTLELVIETKNQIIDSQRVLIDSYKKELGVPVGPERAVLRVV